jgi:hypothetical protein
MAMAYYEHRMHRGVAAFATEANWILDTTNGPLRNPASLLAG